MTLRLHTRYQNSAGQRVRIVLNLKGLAYEYAAIRSLSSQAYRDLNPQGLMPLLEVDGRFIAQSMAIIELLEERFPDPAILPDDPLLRAEVRAFAHAICADLHPINNQRVRRYLRDQLGHGEDAIRQMVSPLGGRDVSGTGDHGDAPTRRSPIRVRRPARLGGGVPGSANGQCAALRMRPRALSATGRDRRRMSRPGCVSPRRARSAARLSRLAPHRRPDPRSQESAGFGFVWLLRSPKRQVVRAECNAIDQHSTVWEDSPRVPPAVPSLSLASCARVRPPWPSRNSLVGRRLTPAADPLHDHIAMVSSGLYREAGKAGAAPATVSGEPNPSVPLDVVREGRIKAVTREPGDLPSLVH